MTIKELFDKILQHPDLISGDEDEIYINDEIAEALVDVLTQHISSISKDDRNKEIIPLIDNFHKLANRHLILRALETFSTEEISNILFSESLLEKNVSLVIPYLRVILSSEGKETIRNKVESIYLSEKYAPRSKEQNNLEVYATYLLGKK